MVTIGQRIEQLRMERSMSRPALSAALGFPKTAIEKFETGRATPSMEQQEKLAAYFGVLLDDLQGKAQESMSAWMDGAFMDEPQHAAPAPRPQKARKPAAVVDQEDGTMFDAFLSSKKFQEALKEAALDALRSPVGQELLAKAIRRELARSGR